MSHPSEIISNPFAVKTPENLTAKELIDLFVPYPEYNNLLVSGHQFLNGHRGSGKSMMLRMMCPDSQMLTRQCPLSELPFFGVYLSIKATEVNAPEYARLEFEPSGTVLSEHVLTTKLLSALFASVRMHCLPYMEHLDGQNLEEAILTPFIKNLQYGGWSNDSDKEKSESAAKVLDWIIECIDDIQRETVQYIKRRSFSETSSPYQGALLGFQDTILPIVATLAKHNIFPKPVYFLLDDADNLTRQQHQILNTWVSYRATELASLKISTQLSYKTYETTSGVKIEAPHDYSSINFTAVQTGSVKERYPQLVAEIVKKRLQMHGLENPDPYIFFPKDDAQEAKISEIGEEYRKKWHEGESGAYRSADDVYRYSRPEYIRRLALAKQGARYRYAGFEQLVHISSGIIRFFLEPAARMFTEQQQSKNEQVRTITPAIQDQELRKQADQLLLENFDELQTELSESPDSPHLRDIERLRNLVTSIGSRFKANIMDETQTQRRVFSFSISGEPSPEVISLLKLGIRYGYFYLGSIGAKSGMGRSPLYVLTRRLAPAFSLDPVGFSGYLTIQNHELIEMADKPQTYINRLRKSSTTTEDSNQLSLLGKEND